MTLNIGLGENVLHDIGTKLLNRSDPTAVMMKYYNQWVSQTGCVSFTCSVQWTELSAIKLDKAHWEE